MSNTIKSTPLPPSAKAAATAAGAIGASEGFDKNEVAAMVQRLIAGIMAAGPGGAPSMGTVPAVAPAAAPPPPQPLHLSEQQMQVVGTLHEYRDLMPASLKAEDLDALANQAGQPEELREAYLALRDDPALFEALDSAGPAQGLSGSAAGLDDGILCAGDVDAAYFDEQLDTFRDREWMQTRNETLAAFMHHADRIPDTLTREQCAAYAQDTTLPEDLRQAYANLSKDPTLFGDLDAATPHGGLGGSTSQMDGTISRGDFEIAFRDPFFNDYSREKSKLYTHNYIPSDAQDDELVPREMVGSDASRELYLYAESLPGQIDRATLERIASGQVAPGCKYPAQLQAAAQYMLDHPEEWERMAPGGSVNRDDLQNNLVAYMHLTAEEGEAVAVLAANKDVFLREGGWVTRDSLTRLAEDPSVSPEIRAAARTLLNSPVIFGQLDNGLFGHHSSLSNRTFDGMFGGDDIDNYLRKLETYKPPPPPEPVPPPPPPPPPEPVPTESEVDAVHTVQDHSEVFQDENGDITRDSLHRVASDESLDAEYREAALMLLASPSLFKTVDGAGSGASGAGGKPDGKISSQDLARFDAEVERRRQKAEAYAAYQQQQAERAQVQADMLAGRADDPAVRKACGGAEIITGVLGRVLDVVGKVLDAVKTGLDVVAGFLPPPFGAIVAGVGAGIATVNNFAVKAGEAMCEGVPPGEAFAQAGKDYAMDLAGSALSMAPGGAVAGKALLQGGKAALQAGGKVGAEVVEQGVKAGVREGAQVGGKAAGKQASEEVAEAGARRAGQEGGGAAPKKTGEQPAGDRPEGVEAEAAAGKGRKGEPEKTGDEGKGSKKLKDEKDKKDQKDEKDDGDAGGRKDSKTRKDKLRRKHRDHDDHDESTGSSTQAAPFGQSTGAVSDSIQQGIDAGHEIAALMQQLSLAAAMDSATKKAGEQAKSAAQ